MRSLKPDVKVGLMKSDRISRSSLIDTISTEVPKVQLSIKVSLKKTLSGKRIRKIMGKIIRDRDYDLNLKVAF